MADIAIESSTENSSLVVAPGTKTGQCRVTQKPAILSYGNAGFFISVCFGVDQTIPRVRSDLTGRQHIFDQADHHVLGLGVGLGYQQSQRSQADIIDDWPVITLQAAVASQKIDEHIRANALYRLKTGGS